MAKKRKEQPTLQGVEILDIAAEGNAVARPWGPEGMVLFVPFAAPGDVATVKIDRKRHSYAEGHIVSIEKPSDVRVEPRCSHFGVCGGCRWQHLPYPLQLQAKQKQVEDALTRIAHIELPPINPILGSKDIWCYRNKMEYTFSSQRWRSWNEMHALEEEGQDPATLVEPGAGFHIPGAFDKVLDVEACHLQDDLGNQIRLFVKDYAKSKGYSFYDLRRQEGLLRTLMIRIVSTGQTMVLMAFGADEPDKIADVLSAVRNQFPEITSLQYAVNLKANDSLGDQEVHLHSGKEFIKEEMEGLQFRIGPKSFYQTNSRQAHELYNVVRDFASLTGSELVYDLYTGTGTIANFLASKAKKVVGIEYVPEAIEDAKINSQANGITNTVFYAGDMKEVLTEQFINANGRPDVMVIDPPRAGMHSSVVETVLATAPERIVYVSCNPATQARDIALMDQKYKVSKVQPVDMFPHTHHVENVVLLSRRQ